jgi:H+-transporting ATPase
MSPQEETEESLSSLINDLVAEDGKEVDPDVLSLRPIEKRSPPANLMDTQPHQGLTDAQVADRRKDYGRNCMTQDKTNHWIKFLMFFMGPIQWVMEVSKLFRNSITIQIDIR